MMHTAILQWKKSQLVDKISRVAVYCETECELLKIIARGSASSEIRRE